MSGIFGHWSLDYPALAYVLIAGALYFLGGRARVGGGKDQREEPLRVAAFVAGLATIVIALDSSIDYYSDDLFWVHMTQHILLLTAAPPLILLGRPWPRMWRAIPLRWRTPVGRSLVRARWTKPIRWIAHPLPAWILFSATIGVWHIPAAFNATLSNQAIHDLEHATFFFTGLLFWAHVVDPGPLRRYQMNPLMQSAYLVGAMIVGWILAITLVLMPTVLYPHYAHLLHRPEAITALEDQQMAGGMMWVLGSISYTIAVIIAFAHWVGPEQGRRPGSPPRGDLSAHSFKLN